MPGNAHARAVDPGAATSCSGKQQPVENSVRPGNDQGSPRRCGPCGAIEGGWITYRPLLTQISRTGRVSYAKGEERIERVKLATVKWLDYCDRLVFQRCSAEIRRLSSRVRGDGFAVRG